MTRLGITVAMVLAAGVAVADQAAQSTASTVPPTTAPSSPPLPTPTVADAAYGPHPKQRLTFWKADVQEPTPLVFYIHGGSWMRGDRAGVAGLLPGLLERGISVVSMEYRFLPEAQNVSPPVKAPMHDAARAVQFVRSRASEWNIDPKRIAASGTSAGGCTSLWLAFHDDLADPTSSDPVARQSTRLLGVAATAPQTTLDPLLMKEWTPNSTYGGHAFNVTRPADSSLTTFDVFLEQRDALLPWINEFSPEALVTPDDPSVAVYYATPPAIGQDQKDPTHTANFGVKLQERMQSVGVACEVVYPGAADVTHPTVLDYLVDLLTKK